MGKLLEANTAKLAKMTANAKNENDFNEIIDFCKGELRMSNLDLEYYFKGKSQLRSMIIIRNSSILLSVMCLFTIFFTGLDSVQAHLGEFLSFILAFISGISFMVASFIWVPLNSEIHAAKPYASTVLDEWSMGYLIKSNERKTKLQCFCFMNNNYGSKHVW